MLYSIMMDNKRSHALGAPVQAHRAYHRQQNFKPSQTLSNDVNHQDDRYEVERPTDSSVVAATHFLSDSEILPGQDYSEYIRQR